MTERAAYKKEWMVKYVGNVCPIIQSMLERNRRFVESCTPTWHGDDDMTIFRVTNGIERYYVNLKEGTCAFRKWNLSDIPCSHAISYIWHNKKRPEEYISEHYMYV